MIWDARGHSLHYCLCTINPKEVFLIVFNFSIPSVVSITILMKILNNTHKNRFEMLWVRYYSYISAHCWSWNLDRPRLFFTGSLLSKVKRIDERARWKKVGVSNDREEPKNDDENNSFFAVCSSDILKWTDFAFLDHEDLH